MKLKTDMRLLGKEAKEHPAYESFVRAMEDRAYGREALVSAWAWFRKGWEDRGPKKTRASRKG